MKGPVPPVVAPITIEPLALPQVELAGVVLKLVGPVALVTVADVENEQPFASCTITG